MKQIGLVGIGLLVGLFWAALSGCDAFDSSHQEFASAVNTTQSDGTAPGGLSKAYNEADFYSATVTDPSGNNYTVTYNAAESGSDGAGHTLFVYDLEIGNLSGFHFAIGLPSCAGELLASEPAGGYNNNANGSLEFGPEDFDSSTERVILQFGPDIPLGVVNAGFKYSGAGSDPILVPVSGPCLQVDYWITGTVFLDDPGDPSGTLGVQDDNEPGIGGVEVALFEWDGTPNQGEPTQMTASDGSYAFHVLGPPIFDPHYRVEIRATGGGLNAKLLDPGGIWKVSDTVVRNVDLTAGATVAGIGFWLDINKAIQVYEDAALSETDMLPREFWKVQVTGKGTQKYKPVVPGGTLSAYMAAIGGFSVHIPYVFPEGISLETAAGVFKTASKNDPQEYLRTLTLAALFNYAADRGSCGPDNLALTGPSAGNPIAFPVCVQSDPETTRLIIEQALIEWMRVAGISVGKESGGSMSRVLNAMM